jgi:diadenosine tetraphosphate (Ap4A) HIT family hydrolase
MGKEISKFWIYNQNTIYQYFIKIKYLLQVMSDETIFDKIIRKEIPANIVYEDDNVLAFRDISPQAPVHILIIPKQKDGLDMIEHVEDRHEAILGKLLLTATKIAKQEKL